MTPCLCTALGIHAAHMDKKPKKLQKKFRRIYQSPWSLPNSLTHSPPNIFLLKENQTLIPHPDHKDQQQQKPTRVNPSSTALHCKSHVMHTKLFTPQKTETHKSLSKTPPSKISRTTKNPKPQASMSK